jgi:hypothetical protein
VRLGLRRETVLPHGCHRYAEGPCNVLMGHSLTQSIDGVLKIHVCSWLDVVYAGGYTVPCMAEKIKVSALALPRRRSRYTHLTRTDPEAARLLKLVLSGGPGQENWEVGDGQGAAA